MPGEEDPSDGNVRLLIVIGVVGRIGGVVCGVVPKLRTPIASKTSITPTEAAIRVSGAASRSGR